MTYTNFIENIKSNSEDNVTSFIIENLHDSSIFNLSNLDLYQSESLKSSNFSIKNQINRLPIYLALVKHSINGNLQDFTTIINDNTIDCNIANKIGEIAATNNQFKILEFLFSEGIDFDFKDNLFLEKAAEFKQGHVISYILTEYNRLSKRQKFNSPDYFLENNELVSLDLDFPEEENNQNVIMEIFDTSAMTVLFQKQSIFNHLVRNNMIHDFQRVQEIKNDYADYLNDEINYADLIVLAAKENVFPMFNYLLQNNFDPFFKTYPSLKEDNEFIQKIARTLYKSSSIEDTVIEQINLNNLSVFNYFLYNKEFFNISDKTIYSCLEIFAVKNDAYNCKKIMANGFDDLSSLSIKTKRFLNEIKGNITPDEPIKKNQSNQVII